MLFTMILSYQKHKYMKCFLIFMSMMSTNSLNFRRRVKDK